MGRKTNDPHVESLRYRVIHSQTVDYSGAAPLAYDTGEFSVTLEKDALIVTMLAHTASEEEGRALVEPFLKAWEIQAGLDLGLAQIGFSFQGSNVIDRAPSPQDARTVFLQAARGEFRLSGSPVSLVVRRRHYPPAPQRFSISPDVETMYYRYKGYCEGHEPLLSMANFVLTMLQQGKANKARKAAAGRYCVDCKVLNTLGRLSAAGSPQEARKAPKGGTFQDLSDAEKQWVSAAVRRLILRAGECAAVGAGQLPVVGMADLPPLPARSGGK